jgi:DNA-3-methyladenine glycosylase
LPRSFFSRPAEVVAPELIGCLLVRRQASGALLWGVIVETEAYGGPLDRASHAWKGMTPRSKTMFGPPGTAYVYLCYGMHRMMNVVTAPEGVAAAVLIRGVEPVEGHQRMARRRKYAPTDPRVAAGPGALTQALGIKMSWDGCDLVSGPIRIEDAGMRFRNSQINRGRRVGVNFAGPAARFPWRFSIQGNPWVSRAKA